MACSNNKNGIFKKTHDLHPFVQRAGTSSHSRVWRGGGACLCVFCVLSSLLCCFFTHHGILCPSRNMQCSFSWPLPLLRSTIHERTQCLAQNVRTGTLYFVTWPTQSKVFWLLLSSFGPRTRIVGTFVQPTPCSCSRISVITVPHGRKRKEKQT